MVFLSKYFTNIIDHDVVMRQKEIIKKIGLIIKELQEQHQYVEKTRGVINDLELELFVANTHFLTDHIEILRKINDQQINALNQRSHITDKFFEPVVQPVTIPVSETKELTAGDTDPIPVAEPEEDLVETDEPVEEPILDEETELGYDEATTEYELIADDAEEHGSDASEPDKTVTEETDQHEEEEHHFTISEPDEAPAVHEWEFELERMVAELEQEHKPVDEPHESEPPAADPVYELPAVEPEPEPELPPAEPEPIVVRTPVVEHEPEPELPAVEPEPDIIRTPVVAETSDSDKPVLTINQILAAQQANTTRLHDQLPPISDLRSAINLNDKMLYVKDLFNNYSLSYSEAIEILNRFHSFDDADQFLQSNYATKNNWTDKPATVEKFYSLLRRRFA